MGTVANVEGVTILRGAVGRSWRAMLHGVAPEVRLDSHGLRRVTIVNIRNL